MTDREDGSSFGKMGVELNKTIYLDHATTADPPWDLNASLFYWKFGNPSSIYDIGAKIKELLRGQKLLRLLSCQPENIYFTAEEQRKW